MELTKIESLGISLSKLGFGAMRMPRKGEEPDQEQINRMTKYAHDNGVNYFDTAYVYGDGESEIAIGKALKQIKREDFYIADKMPLWKAKDAKHLDEIFNVTLERLQMDYVDFYLMHALDRSSLSKMVELKAIDWAVKKKAEGKIKRIGFSIHDDHASLVEILDYFDWDFVQIQYNYMDKLDNPGEKGYDELVKRNIPIIIMEPLKGGLLADIPLRLSKEFNDLGGSNVSYAFRWLAEKKGIATILSGMSNMEQMIDNVKIFNDIKPLSATEHDAVLKVDRNIKDVQKVKCTTCGYCLPCPQGIEIPKIFKAWNTEAMNVGGDWIKGTDIDFDSATECTSCEACVKLCPQHINIPEKLAQLVQGK